LKMQAKIIPPADKNEVGFEILQRAPLLP
jgi:hypothetical protein